MLPVWRDRELLSIRRSDVAALLDKVEDEHGARQADYCLNVVRTLMNWYAARTTTSRRRSCAACGDSQPARAGARPRARRRRNARDLGRGGDDGSFGALIRHCSVDRATPRKGTHHAVGGDLTAASGRSRGSRARRIPAAYWCCRMRRAPSSRRSPGSATIPTSLPGAATGRVNGFGKSKARFDGKLPAGATAWTITIAPHRALPGVPRRCVERSRRARHGPRDRRRRGRL